MSPIAAYILHIELKVSPILGCIITRAFNLFNKIIHIIINWAGTDHNKGLINGKYVVNSF